MPNCLDEQKIIDVIICWLKDNYIDIIIAAAIIIIGVLILVIVRREVKRLEKKNKLSEYYGKIIIRITRWGLFLVIAIGIVMVFDITIGAITSVVALFGGTILGFAAINTIGNAIAGFIVMTSKPFVVGDYLLYKDEIAEVISIELMYTKLKTLDMATISIPNQELLKEEYKNFGKNNPITRKVSVTIGYDVDNQIVEQALLEAFERVENVNLIKKVNPIIRMTSFQNYAMEYTMFYRVKNSREIYSVDADVKKSVFLTMKKFNIDLRTPILSLSLNNKDTTNNSVKSLNQ